MTRSRIYAATLSLALSASMALVAACTAESSDSTAPDPDPDVQAEIEQEDANRALLHDYHVTVWEEGHWEQAGNYLGPQFTMHSYPVLPNGQQPDADFFTKWVGAFSDLQSQEDMIIADGDRVVIQWTITAKHTGDFFGIPATQRQIQISGMDVLRVEDGKFVEQWGGIADQMDDVVQQLTYEEGD